MEEKRKQQLLQQADKAYKSWINRLDQESSIDDIDEQVEMISNALAFGTIISTGRRNPSGYIGTFKQCKTLKNLFGGQIGVISYVWYWLGYALTDEISKVVGNSRKNLVLNVPEPDLEDTVLNISEIASLDIKYGNKYSGRALYIGGYKVCINLKRRFGGKIGRLYNHWHWIGNASFQSITTTYQEYQKSSKRFKRKRIVFTR